MAGGLDGSISGDNIRLEMTKTDAEDSLKLLPGAEFTLYNEAGKKQLELQLVTKQGSSPLTRV